MAEPTVCVIVPTFNRAGYLPECLESLLAQTFPPTQIIVVNDGSTDNTARVIRPYLDRITYVEKENGGKSTALNLVMPDVRSDYIWIFDDDDVALPDALEIHVAALEADPNAGFSYAACYLGVAGPDGRIQRGSIPKLPDPSQDEFFRRLLEGWFLTGQASLFVRTTCYRSVGAFDTNLIRSQDYDMLLRLSRRFKGLRIDKPTFIYRMHDDLRGHSEYRFPGDLTNYEWYKYDRIIFAKLYSDLSLHEYLPQDGRDIGPNGSRTREALLRRMSIMARKGLWHHSEADLRRLIDDGRLDVPLSSLERRICRDAMDNLLAVEEMVAEKPIHFIFRGTGRRPGATQLRFEFARRLYYHAVKLIRQRQLRLAAAILVVTFRILGLFGTVEAMKFKLALPSRFR